MAVSTPSMPRPAGWDCHIHVFDRAAPVRAGHYTPEHHSLDELEPIAAQHGVGHFVLVQPSVYDTDNSVMLQALAREPGRHAGIAVVEPDISDATLDLLHAAGVRGIRFNLVSPAGHNGDPAADLLRLAPRLRERRWHVQWYVKCEHLPQLVTWQQQTGLVFVLDHMGGLHASLAADAPAWAAARALAHGGAWVKLSGWYRLEASAPYSALHRHIKWVVQSFGAHTVWGSDWPHTSFDAANLPAYESVLQPMTEALGTSALVEMLQSNPYRLYGT
jgi:predicted TIM-barrel fold metal-dependent hydrolase